MSLLSVKYRSPPVDPADDQAAAQALGATIVIDEPVSLASVYHSADTNHDFRISLTELERVIFLYHTKNGTVRTGCYKVNPFNLIDGFDPDPDRGPSDVVTLTRYHSADYENNGKISLTELLRVIELYNYAEGETRTGQYHVQAGTEDGFAPGPPEA